MYKLTLNNDNCDANSNRKKWLTKWYKSAISNLSDKPTVILELSNGSIVASKDLMARIHHSVTKPWNKRRRNVYFAIMEFCGFNSVEIQLLQACLYNRQPIASCKEILQKLRQKGLVKNDKRGVLCFSEPEACCFARQQMQLETIFAVSLHVNQTRAPDIIFTYEALEDLRINTRKELPRLLEQQPAQVFIQSTESVLLTDDSIQAYIPALLRSDAGASAQLNFTHLSHDEVFKSNKTCAKSGIIFGDLNCKITNHKMVDELLTNYSEHNGCIIVGDSTAIITQSENIVRMTVIGSDEVLQSGEVACQDNGFMRISGERSLANILCFSADATVRESFSNSDNGEIFEANTRIDSETVELVKLNLRRMHLAPSDLHKQLPASMWIENDTIDKYFIPEFTDQHDEAHTCLDHASKATAITTATCLQPKSTNSAYNKSSKQIKAYLLMQQTANVSRELHSHSK